MECEYSNIRIFVAIFTLFHLLKMNMYMNFCVKDYMSIKVNLNDLMFDIKIDKVHYTVACISIVISLVILHVYGIYWYCTVLK